MVLRDQLKGKTIKAYVLGSSIKNSFAISIYKIKQTSYIEKKKSHLLVKISDIFKVKNFF